MDIMWTQPTPSCQMRVFISELHRRELSSILDTSSGHHVDTTNI